MRIYLPVIAGLLALLCSLQIWQISAIAALPKAGGSVSFPETMDVQIKNEQPIAVELHQQVIANPAGPSFTVPLEVKVTNKGGFFDAVPVRIDR
ncbi:MAG TPA: hypothetical protein VJL82_00585 [Rhizomicrobium sp.]|nr:hypothetical protein [Rhizomicrobium sp.]